MRTSDQGLEMLEGEEGVVLRAYRCPAGVWTIGTGLTAASGVVKPKKGMTITREENRRLTRLALARNYEPRVARALGAVAQHVFDGAVSFDWNTGAILRARWVGEFLAGRIATAALRFKQWNKAGGKVLAGLTARRGREWTLIEFGRYPAGASSVSEPADYAADLRALGYREAKLGQAVRAFQAEHGLTVDGIVGPATRATIARVKAERQADKATGAASAGGATAGGGAEVTVNPAPGSTEGVDLSTLLWALGGALVLGLTVYLLFLAWRYRGPLFAWLPEPVKDWFEGRGIVLGRRVRT